MTAWLVIAAVAIGTYGLRVSMFLILGRWSLPAWTERPIFGKIRYMAASGLERKCDIQGYVNKIDRLLKKA